MESLDQTLFLWLNAPEYPGALTLMMDISLSNGSFGRCHF